MLEQGTIVRSIAGRDKHRYFVVLQSTLQEVVLIDGKVRKLASPKSKNRKHVQATKHKVCLQEIVSDLYLRKLLQPMNESLSRQKNQREVI